MIPPTDDDEVLADETHYPPAPDHWTNHEDETSWINGPGDVPVDDEWPGDDTPEARWTATRTAVVPLRKERPA